MKYISTVGNRTSYDNICNRDGSKGQKRNSQCNRINMLGSYCRVFDCCWVWFTELLMEISTFGNRSNWDKQFNNILVICTYEKL